MYIVHINILYTQISFNFATVHMLLGATIEFECFHTKIGL